MNNEPFGQSFNDFAKKTFLRCDLLIRAVGIKTFSAIIKDTPVGDPDLWKVNEGKPEKERKGPPGYVGGRLRGNWNCSLGWPNVSTIEHIPGDEYKADWPGTAEQTADVHAKCNSATRHSVLWLSNGLPYAGKIEYDSHSKQAPAGMVRRNVARIKQNLANELARIKATT